MDELFSRNELYWGKDFQKRLMNLNIAIFGLGGVGGYALEALARMGVSKFTIVDFDKISKSNINRQIIALNSNCGKKKTEEFEKRLKDINPNIVLRIFDDFYDESLNQEIFSEKFDFVLDAIDTLKSKVDLISHCVKNEIPLISSLGAGSRVDVSKIYMDKIENIKPNCQFAKNILSKLKKNDVDKNFYAISSFEKPKSLKKIENIENITKKNGTKIEFRKFTPASIVSVVAVCGYFMADTVVKILQNELNKS